MGLPKMREELIMGKWDDPWDKPIEIKLKPTLRNFLRSNFVDTYGSQCSIQESSSVTPRLWLGVSKDFQGKESTRMHLSQEQVRALLPHLHAFVQHGRLIRDIES